MKKTTAKNLAFERGSLVSLKNWTRTLLKSFPRLFEHAKGPILFVYPGTDTCAPYYKLRFSGSTTDWKALTPLNSMLGILLKDNPLKSKKGTIAPLQIRTRKPTSTETQQARDEVKRYFEPLGIAPTPEFFASFPALSKESHDNSLARERVAAGMLRRGDLSLLDYLVFLIPEIQNQKTVFIAASVGNAAYIKDFLLGRGISADTINKDDSVAVRERKVEKMRHGNLLALVLVAEKSTGMTFTDDDDDFPDMRDDAFPELCLGGDAPQDSLIDLADQVYTETALNWREMKTAALVLSYFPKHPVGDDLLDLYELNKKLKSAEIEKVLQQTH